MAMLEELTHKMSSDFTKAVGSEHVSLTLKDTDNILAGNINP